MDQMNEMMKINASAPQIMAKWGKELNAINEAFDGKLDFMRQATTAMVMESTANAIDRVNAINGMGSMNEATQLPDVGYFKKYAINLLAAAVPNLIAHDIVSTQPMMSRVGELRYLKVLYGTNKGSVRAGDTMFSTFIGGNGATMYSADEVDADALQVATTAVTGNLAWLPVIPGSVKVTIEGIHDPIVDDGKGKFVTNASVTAGTIDYKTGAVSITLAANPSSVSDALANYMYDNITAPVKAPEVNLKIEVLPIIARSRKLKTLYSFDSAFDMNNDYGMEINNTLVAYTASQIKHEIDGEIMNDLLNGAGAKAVTWSSKPRDGISLRDHNESFLNTVIEAGNNIFDATKLAGASYIIVGIAAANIVESLPRFNSAGAINPVGPHLCGYLGDKPVYKNPFYPSNTFLVGWKGSGLFDAGYVYAPYQPIMTTNLIMDAEFQGQRGFATSYGKKMTNGNMYCKGTIVTD